MRYKSLLLALLTVALPLSAQTSDNEITVAVFALNDFHGAFVQNDAQRIPGAPSVLQTLDSLKTVYPNNITVSVGDNFGGSYFYNMTKGTLLPVFFNEAGITLSAVGNHEFDDGQEQLAAKWNNDPLRPKGWDISYVCSNVYDAQGKVPAYMKPFAVKKVGNVRIAFLGMLASSAKEQISARRIVGMTFRGDYTKVLDSLKAQPDYQGVADADLRFFLFHIGAQQKSGEPKWFDKNEAELYQLNDPAFHGFLAGHSHDPVCGRINSSQKPITQGWWHGNFIEVMKCRIDTVTKQVISVEPQIVEVPLRPRNQLTPHALRLQEQIDSLLSHTTTDAGVPIGTKLTVCTEDMPHDRTEKYRISNVGTLVCEGYAAAYRKAAAAENVQGKQKNEPVIGVSHFGGIRAGFTKGDVTVLEVGEVLPFSNNMRAFRVDGKLFRELVNFGYHNQRYGWLQASNLQTVRDKEGNVKKLYYTDEKGKRRKIKDNTQLVVVADDFLSNGGVGYDQRFFPADREIFVKMPKATDCFIQYLQGLDHIPH